MIGFLHNGETLPGFFVYLLSFTSYVDLEYFCSYTNITEE